MVHYNDADGGTHAAIIKKIIPPEQSGRMTHAAHLHVFHSDKGWDHHLENIQHSASGFPNTWRHIDQQ
jgi:hypothetical protein